MTNRVAWLLIILVLSITVSACNTKTLDPTPMLQRSKTPVPSATSTLVPTDTPVPTATFTNTPTDTLEPTSTFTPTPTPTLTSTSYPTKQFILNYTVSGFHTAYDGYLDWQWSRLVLYSDGQLIIPGKPHQQKFLSTDEINQFLAQLENMGFYRLESNQQHDTTDQLYNFGDQYSRVYDGLFYCVSINDDNARNLCAYNPFREFLAPEMKNILEFLDEYQSTGMSSYCSDRILLHVLTGRNPYDDSAQIAVPWPEYLPPLNTPGDEIVFIDRTLNERMIYFEGEDAKEICDFRNSTIQNDVFIQDDIEYTVYMKVVLPHKNVRWP